jgi:hypothetical protein
LRRGGRKLSGGHPQTPVRGKSLCTPSAIVIERHTAPKPSHAGWTSGRFTPSLRRLLTTRQARGEWTSSHFSLSLRRAQVTKQSRGDGGRMNI